MPLTDGDVAALARQAVDLLDPDIDIAIEPDERADPYRWERRAWHVWPLIDGHRTFSIHVFATEGPVEVLGRIVDSLSENAPGTARFYDLAFPPCVAGHDHAAGVRFPTGDRDADSDADRDADSDADADIARDAVELHCPESGELVDRLVPDLPA